MENSFQEYFGKCKKGFVKHPIFWEIFLGAELIGFVLGLQCEMEDMMCRPGEPVINWGMVLVMAVFFGLFTGVPISGFIVLTIRNLVSLFRMPKDEKTKKKDIYFERVSVCIFIIGSLVMTALDWGNIRFGADWHVVLQGNELHAPIFTQTWPTMLLLVFVAVVGYLILSFRCLEKLPPLVIVFSMAAMYIGIALCVVWGVQVFGRTAAINDLMIYYAPPLNFIVIALKTIRYKMIEWREISREMNFEGKSRWLCRVDQKLNDSANWPVAALIAMLPLLGILIIVLVLYGQRADDIIRAWTETSDWRLSAQIAPPNVEANEHYLCTVAAGGHKKVVKPLRMGERNGHRVVVNRQLCIANAFEQILEERVPGIHRCVRCFYDTYGFPVAKLIRSRCAADIVYFLMKPLEWIFLIVLYTCDVKPEKRIAVQYLPICERRELAERLTK